jgi:dihydroorotate dehydrogenase
MNNKYKIIAVFEYSSEAHITKSKLDSEGFKTMLMDEKTIDSDPLISNAIGGVKLLVHKNDFEKALEIYNEIRAYQKDKNRNNFSCPNCKSNRILIACRCAKKKKFLHVISLFRKN